MLDNDDRLKSVLPKTLSIGQLIKILHRYPENMLVIITWESTLHSLEENNIYESKEGHLYLDADANFYKDDFMKINE